MGAWRLAFGPQLVVIALMGVGAAGCSDSSRFDSNPFASENTGSSHDEVTGSIPRSTERRREQAAPASRRQWQRGDVGRRPRHGVLSALSARQFRRHRLAAAGCCASAPAVLELGRRHADHAALARHARDAVAAIRGAGRRHHAGQQHQQPGAGACRATSGHSASERAGRGARGPAAAPRCKCAGATCGGADAATGYAGRAAANGARADVRPFMSSPPARRCAASRTCTASRLWCSPRPITSLPTAG